jgi:uncharacterized protein involved in exopolysaccharide biosynthesis
MLAVVIMALGFGLSKTRTYTTTSSFLVQSRRTNAIQGLAAQFGISVPGQDGGESPNFYLDLIRSREVLGAVVDSGVLTSADKAARPRALADLFEIAEQNPARRRERAINALRARMSANVAQRTGVVAFTVTTPWPETSRQIAQRVLGVINDFNLRSRQSQAAAERRFTERRLGEVRAELRSAEADLLSFAQRNRDIRHAPELLVQQERLQREVSLRQQVYTNLAQSLEQAKIEEVRDTPVISVVERPIAASIPDGRGLRMLATIALVLGGLLGAVLAAFRDSAQRPNEEGADSVEFHRLRREVLLELRRPWRLVLPDRR